MTVVSNTGIAMDGGVIRINVVTEYGIWREAA
jgi:hypothetical protein